MTATPEPRTTTAVPRDPREKARLAAGVILGGLVALFAALNLDEVDVNWILGTWSTPLIVVIVATFLVGALAGWFARPLWRRRQARIPQNG